MTTEQLRPLPKDRDVPAWIRRLILRGLKADPAARWQSMAVLIHALESDPAIKLRRRLMVGGSIAAVAATLLVAWQMVSRRRAEAEREIARHLEQADVAVGVAHEKLAEARSLRDQAIKAFDSFDKPAGEVLWRRTRALLPAADSAFDQAERSLETALMVDGSRSQHQARLADVRFEHLLFAEDFRMTSKQSVLEERLVSVDIDGSRRKKLAASGKLSLRTTPIASRVVLERYEPDPLTGRRNAKTVATIDGAGSTTSLTPGSYRLTLDGPGLAHVVHPFEVRRGEQVTVDLPLPKAAAVPHGFVYVPTGEFWFGDGDELLRSQFLGAVPLHRRRTDAYLIAQHETTYAEWIAFLEALPRAQRSQNLPDVSRDHPRVAAAHGDRRWLAAGLPAVHEALLRAQRRAGGLRGTATTRAPGLAALSGRWNLPQRSQQLHALAEEHGPRARRAVVHASSSGSGPLVAATIGFSRLATS